MNFDKLLAIVAAIVLGFAATGNLGTLKKWVWMSQAKVLEQSRTSTWGSPRFFPKHSFKKR